MVKIDANRTYSDYQMRVDDLTLFFSYDQRYKINRTVTPEAANELRRMSVEKINRYFGFEVPAKYKLGEISFIPLQSTESENRFLLSNPSTNNLIVMKERNGKSELSFFSLEGKLMDQDALEGTNADIRSNIERPLNLSDDSTIVFIDGLRHDRLFSFDVQRKRISNIDLLDSSNTRHFVKGILHSRKDATPIEQTIVGFDDNDSMLIDLRVPQPVVQFSNYKGNNSFICGVTTPSGKLALGSLDNFVRFYKSPGLSVASSKVDIHQSEILLSLDVSTDERWVLVTSKYDIAILDRYDYSYGKINFCKRATEEDCYYERRCMDMKETSDNIRKKGEFPNFISGKFSMKDGDIETIVGAVEKYLISWPSYRFKLGGECPSSLTAQMDENIVDLQVLGERDEVAFITKAKMGIAGLSYDNAQMASSNLNPSLLSFISECPSLSSPSPSLCE